MLGSVSNNDGNGNENVYFICASSRLFQLAQHFYKNAELSRNQIGRSGVQVKKENEKFTVVRSRSSQNPKYGHFTLLFCRGRQRNVPKCKTYVQSDCFCLFNRLRCRCRYRRRVLKLSSTYNCTKHPLIYLSLTRFTNSLSISK